MARIVVVAPRIRHRLRWRACRRARRAATDSVSSGAGAVASAARSAGRAQRGRLDLIRRRAIVAANQHWRIEADGPGRDDKTVSLTDRKPCGLRASNMLARRRLSTQEHGADALADQIASAVQQVGGRLS